MNNYSKQREAVLEVIEKSKIHPTAQEVYELVLKKEPKISRSTVYRNINILVEQGKIKKITMSLGPDRYDYIDDRHAHIICEKCGKVYDFYYNFNNNQILQSIEEQTKRKIEIKDIAIYGICENCKSKI